MNNAMMLDKDRCQYLCAVQDLLVEVSYINDRVMCGDYSSARHALKFTRTALKDSKKLLESWGASDVFLETYVASGDNIGVQWHFSVAFTGADGLPATEVFKGSAVPYKRRD